MKLSVKLSVILGLGMLMSACSGTKDVQYIKDFPSGVVIDAQGNQGLIIEPEDLLGIVVTTKDPELGTIFNLQPGTVTADLQGSGINSTQQNKTELGYRVDSDGNITFPMLGQLHVAGLTRRQVETMIKQRLIKEGYLKDFSVQVSFKNAKISILGDVGSPGNYEFKDDKYTVLQAIADAGDLQMTAEREIMVIREKNGKRQLYKIDMASKSLFDSPAYYLQQNDIIYVLPNDKKAGERDINSNPLRNMSTWMSLVTFATSMVTLVIALTK
ncbi:MAG: polysaccharide biosynthesis/export family protein [Muribaculaceae bacterium]|nr:polysaccharide biosynthesis/export family protein [Muribaculaceae bacterium]